MQHLQRFKYWSNGLVILKTEGYLLIIYMMYAWGKNSLDPEFVQKECPSHNIQFNRDWAVSTSVG
jgi:hypothetical protein